MEQRFLEAVSSLELARAAMQGSVPNAAFAALKERYTKLLAQMGRLAGQYQRMCKLMDGPAAVKQLPPDDWRRYEEDGEGVVEGEAGEGEGGGEAAGLPGTTDLDEAEDGLAPDFVESVKAHRDRLTASYRNYRKCAPLPHRVRGVRGP